MVCLDARMGESIGDASRRMLHRGERVLGPGVARQRRARCDGQRRPAAYRHRSWISSVSALENIAGFEIDDDRPGSAQRSRVARLGELKCETAGRRPGGLNPYI